MTRISEKDGNKYKKVVEKFDEYFKVRNNIIFERARFNWRNQQPGEVADKYITVFHQLAQGCKYGKITDQLIHDQLNCGHKGWFTLGASANWVKPHLGTSQEIHQAKRGNSAETKYTKIQ